MLPSIALAVIRSIWDPEEDEKLKGHWGEHVDNLTRYVNSKQWEWICNFLKNELARHDCYESGDFNVLFVCRSGRHRSLAAAKLFTFVALYLGIPINFVEHVSQDHWPRHFCATCDGCLLKEPRKKIEIRKRALETWHAVS